MRRLLISSAAVDALLGSRCSSFSAGSPRPARAIVLVALWIAPSDRLLVCWRRPGSRLLVLGPYAGDRRRNRPLGYLTGFRDMRVDEEVAVASVRASDAERPPALAGEAGEAELRDRGRSSSRADGSGRGRPCRHRRRDHRRATRRRSRPDLHPLRRRPGRRRRRLPHTERRDVSDRVELGGLKGNVGDQQYEIPADTDLGAYSYVVLWCKPFTVRIAVAALDA